jgi:hypothetical protein
MVFKLSSSPLGGRTRTRTLAALSLLRSSYPRELARVLGASLTGVRKARVRPFGRAILQV